MARIITKQLALKIAEKLRATIYKSGGAHDLATVKFDGKVVASFGIRRSSDKDIGHDHIPSDIHVGPGFAKLLGQCPKSFDDWVAELRKKGLIPEATNSGDSGNG